MRSGKKFQKGLSLSTHLWLQMFDFERDSTCMGLERGGVFGQWAWLSRLDDRAGSTNFRQVVCRGGCGAIFWVLSAHIVRRSRAGLPPFRLWLPLSQRPIAHWKIVHALRL